MANRYYLKKRKNLVFRGMECHLQASQNPSGTAGTLSLRCIRHLFIRIESSPFCSVWQKHMHSESDSFLLFTRA